MMIHEITETVGKHKARKRVGRGIGSGHGKTCGKGHKGARSRSGWSQKANFEGGQMPFYKRFEKRGFSNAQFKKHYSCVNVSAIAARYEDGEEVSPETLVKVGLIKNTKLPVKVLGDGEISKKLTVVAAKFTKSAEEKITAAGGSVTVQ